MKLNYAFNPIAEQVLRPSQTLAPQRVNAALGLKMGGMSVTVDFFENGLCFHCQLAQTEIRHYSEFHHGVEELWQQQDEQVQNEISALLLKFPEAEHDDIVDSHGWELHCNQQKYPAIHRGALTVVLYSFVESNLNQLCDTVRDSCRSPIALKEIAGQGIERAVLYLKRIGGFDFGKISAYADIKNLGLIRNILVHAGGDLPANPDAPVCKFVAGAENLRGASGGSLQVDAAYVFEAADMCVRFFEQLGAQVKLFMDRVDRGEA